MTPDDLRALADALDRIARTHAMIAPAESEMQHRAADYLRACAEAQPVPAGWKLVSVEPTEAHLASMGMRHRHDYGMLDEKFQDSIRCQMRQLYEEAIGEGFFKIAAPAVPQAEPIDPHMIVAEDRFPDEQAEPKREALTYEQLVSACYTYRHDFGLLDPDEQELVIEEAGRWANAFGIGDSDAE